jgi:hypothetical protein
MKEKRRIKVNPKSVSGSVSFGTSLKNFGTSLKKITSNKSRAHTHVVSDTNIDLRSLISQNLLYAQKRF